MNNFNTIRIEQSIIVNCGQDFRSCGVSLKEYCSKNGKILGQFALEHSTISGKLIMVIGGGMSAERDVSYMSAHGIVMSLIELRHRVVFVDMGMDIANIVLNIKPDIIYNALHGTYGEDGCLAGMLNILRIPYTGPGVLSSALALNKKKSCEIFRANNINVADSMIVAKNDNYTQDPMPRPYVIKPIAQGSSIGVEVIFKEDDFQFSQYKFEYGDEILVEKYIKGRELQVAVLNGKALGVLEIKISADKRFYDYEVKYGAGLAEHLMPAPVPDHIYQESLQLSEKLYEIYCCTNSMIRVELIYCEAEDKLYVLEINTHPGMTPLSICPEIAAHHGIGYTQLVQSIVDQAKFEM